MIRAALLRLRHEWPWRWAHHPLCDRFRADVLRVGRLHLCRSCTALWTGFAAAAVALAVAPPNVGAWGAAAALLALVALHVRPEAYARRSRAARDGLRASIGAVAAAVLVPAVRGDFGVAALLGTAAAGVLLVLVRRRRAARATRCDGCPELGAGVCSGYALQADALRAWEEREVARRLAGGFRPAAR